MNKREVRISNWPFETNEKVKLIWIGEPFRENKKWLFNAYFKGEKAIKKVKLDWASIHFLSINKFYINGNLNNGQAVSNSEILKINLSGIKAEYREKEGRIYGDEFVDKTKSKTFNFRKYGKLYSMPLIEVIRTIFAPDKFMLNRVLEMDTLEDYFTFIKNGQNLNIYFTYEYEQNLLKNEKVNHLAWIITNPDIYKMFNNIGENIWKNGELKFDFIFNKFDITAIVENKGNYIRILQILSLNRKKINAKEINIFHPSLEESKETSESKLWKFARKSDSPDREVNSEADGSTKDSEEISTYLINHSYEDLPVINKQKRNKAIKRSKEDENTKLYVIEDDKIRTTADSGGMELVKGLEFTTTTDLDTIGEKGELGEFIEILNQIKLKVNVASVNILAGDVPELKKGKGFSKLSDGISNRKFVIGKITMVDSTDYILINVEREEKALSMLLLYSANNINWSKITKMVLLGLVKNHGTWDSEVIQKLERYQIYSQRIKHKRIGNIYAKSEHIFSKLIY